MIRVWRNLLVGVFALLILVLGALLVLVPLANAATLQQRGDETAAWMAQVLRAQVTPRTFEVGTAPGNAGEATPDGMVRLAAWTTQPSSYALYVQIHELAHRPENAACWGMPGSPERDVEEGIADALTQDLIPAAVRRFTPEWGWYRGDVVGGYAPQVSSIRYAIRSMTGNKGWGRAERLQLRKLWASDCAGRAAMLNR